MPLVSDVLRSLEPPPREGAMWTTCPECDRVVRLNRAIVSQVDPLETVYLCPDDGMEILIISTPSVVPWEGRGHRIGTWAIRNPRPLYFQPLPTARIVEFAASPHALD